MFPEPLKESVEAIIRAIREKDFGVQALTVPVLRVLLYLAESGIFIKPVFGMAGGATDAVDVSSYTDDDLADLLEAGLEDSSHAKRYGDGAAGDVSGGLPGTIVAALLVRLLSRLIGLGKKS